MGVDESDGECDSERSFCEVSSLPSTSRAHSNTSSCESLSSRSTSVPVSSGSKEGFRVAEQLCRKANYSRQTLSAAFFEADQNSRADGFLMISELATVFQNFSMSERDAEHFHSSMKVGGNEEGLYWREAVAIMAPLFKRQD